MLKGLKNKRLERRLKENLRPAKGLRLSFILSKLRKTVSLKENLRPAKGLRLKVYLVNKVYMMFERKPKTCKGIATFCLLF